MESAEHEIEGYQQCLSSADDLEAVRNSYKVCIPSTTKHVLLFVALCVKI